VRAGGGGHVGRQCRGGTPRGGRRSRHTRRHTIQACMTTWRSPLAISEPLRSSEGGVMLSGRRHRPIACWWASVVMWVDVIPPQSAKMLRSARTPLSMHRRQEISQRAGLLAWSYSTPRWLATYEWLCASCSGPPASIQLSEPASPSAYFSVPRVPPPHRNHNVSVHRDGPSVHSCRLPQPRRYRTDRTAGLVGGGAPPTPCLDAPSWRSNSYCVP
jgi:hypothetical protein